MANRNKSPLKILEKMERGRLQGLSKFFGYPLLSRERVKLRTSNLASTFIGPVRIKAHKDLEKRERGVSSGCPNFLGTPYYLRKSGLDVSDAKNYRPVSNLTVMSKIIHGLLFRFTL